MGDPGSSAGMILSGAVCLGIYGAFGMTFGKWGRLRKIKAADLAVFAVLPLFFFVGMFKLLWRNVLGDGQR